MRYLLMTIAFLLLTACGQKGALYLENDQPESSEVQSASTEVAGNGPDSKESSNPELKDK